MTDEDQRGTWLTSRRLRAHGLILGMALWSVYLWMIATPTWRDRYGNLKGTDFLHFYTLGCLAREHRGADLYDMRAQGLVAAQRVPDASGIRYLPLYPPQVSILFAPLARLSYGWALAAWWLCSALIYGACCFFVWRACPELWNQRITVLLLALAYPAFFHLIAWGQTSAIALGIFTLVFFALRERQPFLAGIAFGCLVFKPQLGLAGAVVFLLCGSWRLMAGAAASAVAQLGIGILYYGAGPFRAWLQMLKNVRGMLPFFEPRVYQTHCLRTFWSMIVPRADAAGVLYVISASIVLGLTITVWKRREVSLPLRYSTLLLASVLVAPHLTVYDLVILAPALLLISDWLLTQGIAPATRSIGTLLYAVYMLPLVGPISRWTHVQLSVVAMLALLYLIWKQARAVRSSGQPRTAVTTCP